MTPAEITLAHNGYRMKMAEFWEMTRYECYYSLIAPNVKMKKDIQLKDVKIPPDYLAESKKKITPDMIMKVKKVNG